MAHIFSSEWCRQWLWRRRLDRVERLLRRQRAGIVESSVRDARFIEKLRPDELSAMREAQQVRRWRQDAIYSLDLEASRLRELLNMSVRLDWQEEPIGENDEVS